MRINELAAKLGATTDEIRWLEKRGYIQPDWIQVGKRKIRSYSDGEEQKITFILKYRRQGFQHEVAFKKAMQEICRTVDDNDDVQLTSGKRRQHYKPLSQKRQAKRNAILYAASVLFAEKSYLGTSIDDIAKAASVNKASIYWYFSEKAELLFEIACGTMRGFLDMIEPIVRSDLGPSDKLKAFIVAHVERQVSHVGPSAVRQYERRSLPLRMRSQYVDLRGEYEKAVRQILEEGIAKGEFHFVDVKLTGLYILGLLNSIVHWYKAGGSYSPRDLSAYACDFVLKALS